MRIWRDLALLAVLMLLAGGVRLWLIAHTEVAARDSIGFIRYAVQLEEQPLIQVLRANLQHPGYPAVLLAVSWPVRTLCGGVDPASMQLSAQLTSVLAAVLLVIPLFYLGCEMFDRRVSFWGTAVFQCLPVSAQITADGLSEATYLFFTTTALLLAMRALRTRSVALLALCGLCIGLAYLTRPEGLLILPAVLLVLVGAQAVAAWRWPWQRALAGTVSLLAVAAAVGGPYAIVIGRLTNKPTPLRMMETTATDEAPGPNHVDLKSPGRSIAVATHLPLAVIFADYGIPGSIVWGLQLLAAMLIKGYYYILWLPTLVGLYCFRGRFREGPELWVLLALALLQVVVLLRLVVVMGYLSDRHVLILVLLGCNWGIKALLVFGDWLGTVAARLARAPRWGAAPGWGVVLALLVACVAGALRPLHPSRAGHHAAGLWLARHLTPSDMLTDPFAWADYYAGRVFTEGKPKKDSGERRPVQYAVLEGSERHNSATPRRFTQLLVRLFADTAPERGENPHSRLPLMDAARGVAQRGQLVYSWPEDVSPERAKVKIYAEPLP